MSQATTASSADSELEAGTSGRSQSDHVDRDIDISWTRCVVAWSGGTHILSCAINTELARGRALIRLRALVELAGRRSTVFLWIRPECIGSVSLVPSPPLRLQDSTAGMGSECLRLEMSRPPDLVGPSSSLVPTSDASHDVIAVCRALVHETFFTISMNQAVMSQLRPLCDGRRLVTIPRLVELASLYGGKGGHIVTVWPSKSSAHPPANPPAYEDAKKDPIISSKKRRANSPRESFESILLDRLAKMDARLAEMAQKQNETWQAITERIDGIEERLDNLSDKQGLIEDEVHELGTDLRADINDIIEDEMSSMEDRMYEILETRTSVVLQIDR